MKKEKKLLSWLKEWDEGNFDFTENTVSAPARTPSAPTKQQQHDFDRKLSRISGTGAEAFRRFYPFITVFLSLFIIFFLMSSVVRLPAFGRPDTPANSSEVIRRYIEDGMTETGAVNIVAGVILDYRAFDTLGESHVLFTAATAVFILMLTKKERKDPRKEERILQDDVIMRNTAKLLLPLIILLGFYIIFAGHLGPGGGFSGGAVIGAGLILYSLAFGNGNLNRVINMGTYRIIVLCALMFYSLSKCYSFFCGANGLETIFSPGIPGRIFSAGLILPLNLAVGIVVACTMYGFYCLFTKGKV